MRRDESGSVADLLARLKSIFCSVLPSTLIALHMKGAPNNQGWSSERTFTFKFNNSKCNRVKEYLWQEQNAKGTNISYLKPVFLHEINATDWDRPSDSWFCHQRRSQKCHYWEGPFRCESIQRSARVQPMSDMSRYGLYPPNPIPSSLVAWKTVACLCSKQWQNPLKLFLTNKHMKYQIIFLLLRSHVLGFFNLSLGCLWVVRCMKCFVNEMVNM